LLQSRRRIGWVQNHDDTASLQDAKQQAGLGDYQVRGWVGWHHHMAMVLMATLFMLEQRLESGEDLPLTCGDIEWVLKQMLPSRGRTEDEILSLLEKRLRKRRAIGALWPCRYCVMGRPLARSRSRAQPQAAARVS
jgi:hypothetical protein